MKDELFSYRLRKYRETHGLSQEELGAALGVTARYIGMMESGSKDVEPHSALAKLFTLMEANKVHADSMLSALRVSSDRVREPGAVYDVNGSDPTRKPKRGEQRETATQARHALMISRITEDTAAMIGATAAQRRELSSQAKNHLDHFVTWLNASTKE